jgi:hypothetical protein
MFAPDELISALADAAVEYVLIGGLAAGRTGFRGRRRTSTSFPPRMPRISNGSPACCARSRLATTGSGTSTARSSLSIRLDPQQLAEGGNFILDTKLGRLDVMQWVPGIPGELAFEHLAQDAVDTALNGRPVKVCSREDLIAMKRAAGRPQDLVDLHELNAD